MAPADRTRLPLLGKATSPFRQSGATTRSSAELPMTARWPCNSAAAAFVAVLAALILGWPSAILAADFSLSGFGTLGFAKSDKPYKYQRFVDDGGTFRRDSVAGIQLDAWLSPSVGATVQALASPSSNHDDRFDGTLAWAFVSWRPTNDWLVRVGKQRIPLYLYSQTYNVGTTYE